LPIHAMSLSPVAVFNAMKALQALLRAEAGREEVSDADATGGLEKDRFSAGEIFRTFFQGLRDSVSALGFGHTAFRLGVRSSLIIGATMAYSVFVEPEFGYWLVLFAVLLIRPNLGISIKAGRDRLIGTIAGSLTAFGFLMLVPAGHPLFLAALLVSLFLMIWFTNLDRFVYMVVALTFMIVGLFTMVYPGGDSLAWMRIAYTAAIVLLVIFVSFLLWPERARNNFAGALAHVLQVQKGYFGRIMAGIMLKDEKRVLRNGKADVEQSLLKLDEVIDAVKNEVLQQRVINHGLEIRNLLYRLLNTLHALDISSRTCSFGDHFQELNSDLQEFAEKVTGAFNALIQALNTRARPQEYPELNEEFLRLRDHFRSIRAQHSEPEDEIRRFWNNSTFIWNLKPLIQELEAIRNEINLKMDESR
ncbi:MAG: FUSC family protein, partial [Bacteroidales bacterium]